MKKRRNLCLFFVITMIFMISLLSADAKNITLKLGARETDMHHESVALQKFADLIEEKTNGEVKVDCYFNEVLGKPDAQLENTIQGVQDIVVLSYTALDKYVEEAVVHSLPYTFKNNDHYKKLLLSDIETEMEEKLLKKTGLRVVNIARNWMLGPYRVLCCKKPILTLEDLEGVKLRMTDSKVLLRAWDALGANVTTISWSEVYLGLSQGLIEAATGTIIDMFYQKFYEVAPYITRTDEKPQQTCILMNNNKFESLTEEQQQAIYDAAEEAGEYCTKLLYENVDKVLKDMKSKGAIFYEPDLTPWHTVIKKVQSEMEAEGNLPMGLIDEIDALYP